MCSVHRVRNVHVVHSVQCIMWSAQCPECAVQSAECAQCTVCSVCTACAVQSICCLSYPAGWGGLLLFSPEPAKLIKTIWLPLIFKTKHFHQIKWKLTHDWGHYKNTGWGGLLLFSPEPAKLIKTHPWLRKLYLNIPLIINTNLGHQIKWKFTRDWGNYMITLDYQN